jgi:hypothetical protein
MIKIMANDITKGRGLLIRYNLAFITSHYRLLFFWDSPTKMDELFSNGSIPLDGNADILFQNYRGYENKVL